MSVLEYVHHPHSLPHEVLEHGALPGALAAHHRDLRQVQVTALPDGAEGVLEPVHQRDQVLHAPVPHDDEEEEDAAESELEEEEDTRIQL